MYGRADTVLEDTPQVRQLRNFGDERQIAGCAYCGGEAATRDHVPSRVLLDEPYPENLPVVPACTGCNVGLSADEEYTACLVACCVAGSCVPAALGSPKIRRILTEKPALSARLAKAQRETAYGTQFSVEHDRVRNVVLKLARGHALFELNEPQYEDPSSITYAPLLSLTQGSRDQFDRKLTSGVWPEVGSRAMQRLLLSDNNFTRWIEVQPGRYRYIAHSGEAVVIRVILSEYLACEVVWEY